jgi:hypothetical protein
MLDAFETAINVFSEVCKTRNRNHEPFAGSF